MKYLHLIVLAIALACMAFGVSVTSMFLKSDINESRVRIANLESANDDLRRKASDTSFNLASFERLEDMHEKTQSDLQACLVTLGKIDRQQRELSPCASTLEKCAQYQSVLQSPE